MKSIPMDIDNNDVEDSLVLIQKRKNNVSRSQKKRQATDPEVLRQKRICQQRNEHKG